MRRNRSKQPGWILAIVAIASGSCAGGSLGWRGSESALAEHRRALSSYKDEHLAALGTRITEGLTETAFLSRVERSRVLWLGDRHTDLTLHSLQRDLLAELRRRGTGLVLVLEALGQEDDAVVTTWLGSEIDTATLRDRIRARWPDSWLDSMEVDSAGYLALLEDARLARDPVFGLEPAPRLPLAKRDAAIGLRVRALAAAHSDRVVVVVVGQSHLCGAGHAVERSGCDGTILVPDPSDLLRESASRFATRNRSAFLVSDAGVHFPSASR